LCCGTWIANLKLKTSHWEGQKSVLALRVNFINVLQADFTLTDPIRAKKTDNLTVFFALLGSASVKAARRISMKLTLDL